MNTNSHTKFQAPEVCIITGGLLNVTEKSMWKAAKKQLRQLKESRHQWLEIKIKLVSAEPIIYHRRQNKKGLVREFISGKPEFPPDLTEVVLKDEVTKQGLCCSVLTCDEIFQISDENKEKLLRSAVIFLSTTLLHDLSELNTILNILQTYNKRIVVGGALAGSLYKYWEGDPRVDILAIGYGEFLVPILCDWAKSDFTILDAGEGRLSESKYQTKFLFSTLPKNKSLDFISKPDWKNHSPDKTYRKISYESVRGCPYRCSFCNYPFLFNDKVFRTKSARKIADDWAEYKAEGVNHIVCLDSLFTMPKSRIEELCHILIEEKIDIQWTCYARADDLENPDLVQLMYLAGARQFQIGIESGSQNVLDAMNKNCTVEANFKAIQNCRLAGITTVVSIIVGFPTDTEETIQQTLTFLQHAKPDFHFLATFSVRVEGVPILYQKNKEKYGLWKMENPLTMAPYWKHNSMCCSEVGNHVRRMNAFLIENKISLDGTIFYTHIDHYKPEMRDALLDYQFSCYQKYPVTNFFLNRLNSFVDKKLAKDIKLQMTKI